MIKKASMQEACIVAQMAIKMWQSHTINELEKDFKDIINSDKNVVFICFEDKQPVGFAQCQLRHDYVEGTNSSPVGYLEGIFICEPYRKSGYGKELLVKCQEWAKEKGCLEFASDCELTNSASLNFHLKMGFTEANRIICFTKQL